MILFYVGLCKIDFITTNLFRLLREHLHTGRHLSILKKTTTILYLKIGRVMLE